MSDTSPILSLPYILPSQAQKHVTHNEALRRLDLVVQLSVLSHGASEAPGTATDGDRHIVGMGAIGAWVGQDGAIAVYSATEGWVFTTPLPGWRAWVLEDATLVVWDGTEWRSFDGHDNLPGVGINASFDTVNRLALSSAASLFSHDGAGHQIKVNKAAPGDTASLLFQTGWSGRAEFGTAGADDFEIKVSADGSAWQTAMRFDAAEATVTGAAIQQGPTDRTAGRLARAEWTYGPATVLGPVSETAGLPTGAVIERGANADGEYVRFADGLQICLLEVPGVESSSAIGALFRSSSDQLWTYPQPFAAEPALTGNVDGGSSWLVFGGGTTTGVVFRRYTAISDSTGRPVRLMALGRWF